MRDIATDITISITVADDKGVTRTLPAIRVKDSGEAKSAFRGGPHGRCTIVKIEQIQVVKADGAYLQIRRELPIDGFHALPLIEEDRTGIKYDPAKGECRCNHDPAYLQREIAARRWVHKYLPDKATGEYVLVCLTCFGSWDHRATDRLIERIMGGTSSP